MQKAVCICEEAIGCMAVTVLGHGIGYVLGIIAVGVWEQPHGVNRYPVILHRFRRCNAGCHPVRILVWARAVVVVVCAGCAVREEDHHLGAVFVLCCRRVLKGKLRHLDAQMGRRRTNGANAAHPIINVLFVQISDIAPGSLR